MDIVQRFDFASGELGDHRKTAIGGLVARANLTRTGVLTYKDPSMPGGVRRELRHPDEVFDADSLDSLAHVPVTDDHPAGKVTPATWRDEAIGHVAGRPKREGKFVSGEIHVQHGPAVQKAERGDLRELSCGYTCNYLPEKGVYDGQEYDGRQTRIRYNHVAAGPVGWGRAGSEVRMRLDAAGIEISVSDASNDDETWNVIQEIQNHMATTENTDSKESDAPDARDAMAQRNRDRFKRKDDKPNTGSRFAQKDEPKTKSASDPAQGSTGDDDGPDARDAMAQRNRDRFAKKGV